MSMSKDCSIYMKLYLVLATFMKKIKLFLKPSQSTLHNLLTSKKWLWNIVNSVPFLANAVMKKVYTSKAYTCTYYKVEKYIDSQDISIF